MVPISGLLGSYIYIHDKKKLIAYVLKTFLIIRLRIWKITLLVGRRGISAIIRLWTKLLNRTTTRIPAIRNKTPVTSEIPENIFCQTIGLNLNNTSNCVSFHYPYQLRWAHVLCLWLNLKVERLQSESYQPKPFFLALIWNLIDCWFR